MREDVAVVHGTSLGFRQQVVSYRLNFLVVFLPFLKFFQGKNSLIVLIFCPSTVRILQINHIFRNTCNHSFLIQGVRRNGILVNIAGVAKTVRKFPKGNAFVLLLSKGSKFFLFFKFFLSLQSRRLHRLTGNTQKCTKKSKKWKKKKFVFHKIFHKVFPETIIQQNSPGKSFCKFFTGKFLTFSLPALPHLFYQNILCYNIYVIQTENKP